MRADRRPTGAERGRPEPTAATVDAAAIRPALPTNRRRRRARCPRRLVCIYSDAVTRPPRTHRHTHRPTNTLDAAAAVRPLSAPVAQSTRCRRCCCCCCCSVLVWSSSFRHSRPSPTYARRSSFVRNISL